MEFDKKIIAIIAVIIVIAIGVVFASGILNSNTSTSPLDTEFMSGTFNGNVELVNSTDSYMASYKDNENDIEYNISTMDNASALMEIYEFQGVLGPEERNFNGQDWNIYFAQAVPTVTNESDANATGNETMGIIICEAQTDSQGYVIYMIIGNNSKVNFTLNTFGEAYTDYAEPLLQSITLKSTDNVPAINEQFGLTADEFAQQIDLIRQYNAGNYSTLEG